MMILLLMLLFAAPAFAQQSAVLNWNANTETDLAGYTVYYGYISCSTVSPLQPPVTLAKVTTYTLAVPQGNSIVSARVTARDTSNNESTKSNCVEKTFVSSPPALTLEERVAILEAKVSAMDAKTSALDAKVTALDNANAPQDLRLTNIEQKLNALKSEWCSLRGRDVTKDVQAERAALGGC